jgi:hypothetical protein
MSIVHLGVYPALEDRRWAVSCARMKEIGMEQATLDNPPLTLGELSELLNRHIENVLIAKVIKDAMQRRVSAASHGAT